MLAAKLRALIRAAGGPEVDVETIAGGAAAAAAGTGWFLADAEPDRAVGHALAWARRQPTDRVVVVVDDAVAAGHQARRAAHFARTVEVRGVVGDTLAPVEPAPVPAEPALDDDVSEVAALLAGLEVDVVVEHGELRGEVLGLEVARVLPGTDGPRLAVGVGEQDRDAFAMVHGDLPVADAVARVVTTVRRHRSPGDVNHPLSRLVPERWLRHLVCRRPDLIDCRHLIPATPTRARRDLRDVVAAPAIGSDGDGRPVVVVTSVGIDLDLVPSAADARAWLADPDTRLLLVVPDRDRHPVTEALAAELAHPAAIVTVPDDWRALDRP